PVNKEAGKAVVGIQASLLGRRSSRTGFVNSNEIVQTPKGARVPLLQTLVRRWNASSRGPVACGSPLLLPPAKACLPARPGRPLRQVTCRSARGATAAPPQALLDARRPRRESRPPPWRPPRRGRLGSSPAHRWRAGAVPHRPG